MNDEIECPFCGNLFSDSKVRNGRCPICGRVIFHAGYVLTVLVAVAFVGYIVMRSAWR